MSSVEGIEDVAVDGESVFEIVVARAFGRSV